MLILFIPNLREYIQHFFYLQPTDITTAGDINEEKEDEDEEADEQIHEKSSFLQMTNIFGQSFVGSAAFRVRKDEKEVSMIKHNIIINYCFWKTIIQQNKLYY